MVDNGEIFAGYLIERLLGRGGMGSVYLVKHPRLPRRSALKLLNREMVSDHEIRARFEREADLVAQLDHPNIVTVFDRGLEDGQLWIEMQYIDGIDAASVEPTRLPPERAVQIIGEVAEALDYAHGNRVLHRDVKPANILLARSTGGKGERVYLTDFGIARLRDDGGHLTQTGTFTATLAYASPEQLTGAALDGRSDQYSLACSLFWLFTGAGPFAASNPAAVIRGHLQQTPPTLSSVRPGLPPALDAVLVKAMSKRPEDRFGTCVEFAVSARRALAVPSSPHMPVAPRYTGGAIPTVGQQMGPRTGPPIPHTAQASMPHTAAPPMPHMAAPPMPTPTPMHTPMPTGMPAPGPMNGMSGPAVQPAYQQPSAAYQQQPSAVYQQQPGGAYSQPGGGYGGGYAPAPMPPQRKSNTGLIIGIIIGVVVLVLIVLVIIGSVG